MIVLRLQLSKTDKNREFPLKQNEILSDAIDRALAGVPLPGRAEDVFQVFVNGHFIAPGLWTFTKLSESDNVVIAPLIQGADTDSVARVVLTIAAVALAGPAAGLLGITSAIGVSAFTAAFTIGSALLINQLIPPSQPQLQNGGLGGDQNVSSSQAYNISGQSNQVRRNLTVPKVYGTHRFFPAVAAQPYTDVETDPATGELSQYLYAIYDFGLGPCRVRNLEIGGTPIEEFSQVQYRFVDPKKPAIPDPNNSTDVTQWEDGLNLGFSLYRGDNEIVPVGYSLLQNEDGEFNAGNSKISPGGAYEEYEVIRDASPNLTGTSQEIAVQVVCPNGLFAYDTQGNIGYREIEMRISFSKAGENIWRAYNDLSFVSSFQAVGGEQGTRPLAAVSFGMNETQVPQPAMVVSPFYPASYYISGTGGADSGFTYLGSDLGPINWNGTGQFGGWDGYQVLRTQYTEFWPHFDRQLLASRYAQREFYGLPIGTTFIYARPEEPVEVGSYVRIQGELVGQVASIANHPNSTLNAQGYRRYNLTTPTTKKYPLQEYYFIPAIGFGTSAFYIPLNKGNLSSIFEFTAAQVGNAMIRAASTQPVYGTFKFTPIEAADYKVRITRTFTKSDNQFQKQDALTVSSINSRFDGQPIQTEKRHTFLEIKIKATNQLNGVIQNLSGIVDSILPVYDEDNSLWTRQFARSPAWIYVDLLTGQINKKAIGFDRIHIPSLLEWAEFCSETPDSPNAEPFLFPRFNCDFILDYDTNLQGVLNQVAAIGQASPNVIDGKYGVLVDRNQTIPVQVFTPRNSWAFSSSRNYVDSPHALRINFIDPGKDWEQNEVVVYDDGYDINTATNIQELQAFGVTNFEQAWRYGRFHMAVYRLRQETITINVDFEHLICTRGDYVQITQDVMKVGGTPARVKSITGNQVVIDDAIETGPFSYGFVFRGSDGTIHQNTLTVVNSDTFDLDGSNLPDPGDLIIIGVVNQVVFDCVVKSVQPNSDLSATITLLEKAPAIYDAESTDTLPTYDPQISVIADAVFAPPGLVQGLVVADNNVECNALGTGYRYYVELDWNPPGNSAVEIYQIYVDYGNGFDLGGQTRQTIFQYVVDETYLGVEHKFKVLAVSATGNKLNLNALAEVSATPVVDSVPPLDVESLSIDITDQVLTLFWPAVLSCDLREYFVRYSPNLGASWETSTPLLRVDRGTSSATTQARTGVYFIKAIDFAGNESNNSAQAVTTIPELFGLNVIDETNDFPDLNGTFDKVEELSGSLVLQRTFIGGPGFDQYEPSGYYYYENLLDLGEIYTVRLQSLIEAEGYTVGDLMVNWPTLDSVLQLNSSEFSEWDVETEYRTTEQFNVIANWSSLSSINFMREGNEDVFSPWRKFTITDATGRIFQFRLRLVSRVASVSPRVFQGTIRADMPDRTESFNNILAPDTGATVTYQPAFKGPGTSPNIQISMDDSASGDYWSFTSKTLEGFTIVFYDSSNNPVQRTFDAQVKGFGRRTNNII